MEFANNPKALENDTANLVLPAHKNLATRLEQLEKTVEELKDRVPDDRATIVVFSGDLDKVLAAFVIATGAAAARLETSMFFTFWGLCALKKSGGLHVIVITPRHQVAVLVAGEFHDRTDAGLTDGEINALAFTVARMKRRTDRSGAPAARRWRRWMLEYLPGDRRSETGSDNPQPAAGDSTAGFAPCTAAVGFLAEPNSTLLPMSARVLVSPAMRIISTLSPSSV